MDHPLSEQEYTARLEAGLETALPLPEGRQPGFAIPENLKERWVFKKGRSRQALPNLLNELNRVDVFLHDSEHTYENMMFEYSTVWDYLPEKGLLLSDDIGWRCEGGRRAFYEFAKKVKRKSSELYS